MNPNPWNPPAGPGGMQPGRMQAPPPGGVSGWEVGLLILALLLLVWMLLALIIAVQARRRGYPFAAWLLAGTLGNPIFLLVLLGAMPDFRRRQLRKKEMADL